MRIITGDYRGRKLETPKTNDVRPTSDKVKESIFNIIAGNIPDAVCVDLFAGTGNLGLEALSRGAKKCYFCDNSNYSITMIKENIKTCRAEEHSTVLMGDYQKTLARINEKVDVFFLDPPYKTGLYENCFQQIRDLDLLAEEGIIIAEHGHREDFQDEMYGFVKLKEKRYGTIVISIYG